MKEAKKVRLRLLGHKPSSAVPATGLSIALDDAMDCEKSFQSDARAPLPHRLSSPHQGNNPSFTTAVLSLTIVAAKSSTQPPRIVVAGARAFPSPSTTSQSPAPYSLSPSESAAAGDLQPTAADAARARALPAPPSCGPNLCINQTIVDSAAIIPVGNPFPTLSAVDLSSSSRR
ncbi:hypothetical protein M0R45_009160 [Rubus argutus]|uniref:Uncharacterized protein n=1 Tax=Rubus argutus TaxID=59490 RepID=A0AAW1Y573_RUBAR